MRKEKDPKKRKSNKASVPPVHSPVLGADRPASADSNKGVASSAALISAASTAVANVCTVEGGNLLATTGPCPSDAAGLSGGNGSSAVGCSAGMTTTSGLNTRTKLPRSSSGIRGVTESRAVQAAALSRALDCLKGTGLSPSKGNLYFRGLDVLSSTCWMTIFFYLILKNRIT